jgi:hypothetical protein
VEDVEEMRRLKVFADVKTYLEFRDEVESARLNCEKAKLALEKHTGEHGC